MFDEVILAEIRWIPADSFTDSQLLASLATDSEGNPSSLAQVVGGTSYETVEALYRDLRRNYEDSLRYPDGGDFYVREMEMKRLGRAPGTGLLSWLKRNISLLSVYWILSKYGESYDRALAWIVGSVLLFAFLRFIIIPSTSLVEAIALSSGAVFQLAGVTALDQVQRIWSVLILALFFLAVRRRLKR